ncbi:MAG: membrane dipeptidase [Pseudomonadota bacterium]
MTVSTVYDNCLIWDDHCGFEMNPDLPLAEMIRPWRDAGVDYLSLNVYYDPQPSTAAIENIAALRRRLEAEVPYCRLVSTTADIDRARAEGKMAITFDIEGMNALNGRIDLIGTYYDLGVRHMLFAYNKNNLAGSGCHDQDTGLTTFGREVIAEMNRVGMVVDCTHTGFRTTMEAMECSSAPVVFSHSNANSLQQHGRNISDEQIKACAATGGVIGINGVNLFLGETEATPKGVARHAAYVAELTGPEHVGITLDYAPSVDGGDSIAEMILQDPGFWPPDAGYDASVSCLDIRQLPAVARELAEIGFSESELAGILGGNFRRIADAVWK